MDPLAIARGRDNARVFPNLNNAPGQQAQAQALLALQQANQQNIQRGPAAQNMQNIQRGIQFRAQQERQALQNNGVGGRKSKKSRKSKKCKKTKKTRRRY